MKKLFSLLLTFTLIVTTMSLFVACDDTITIANKLNGKLVLEANEAGTEYAVTGLVDGTENCSIVIPSTYRGLPVTSIKKQAFENNTELVSVKFENNSKCTTIGASAFAKCTSLVSVSLPESIESVGASAFEGCNSLNIFSIHGSFEVGENAFKNCNTTCVDGINYICGSGIVVGHKIQTASEEYGYSIKNTASIIVPGALLDLEYVVIPKNVKVLSEGVFGSETQVYYLGTQEDLGDVPSETKVSFYSKSEPDRDPEVSYWHYTDGNKPTKWYD